MTTWTALFGLLVLTCGVLGAPVSLCPKLCSCTTSGISVEAHCESFEFLKKSLLSPEQINAIVALDINNGPIIKTNPDLSHLRNLIYLSLTSNKIRQIIAAHLPKSLEYLDLSRNSIRQPPQDLHLLPSLKEANLFGNPISCGCDSLVVRDALLEKGISFVKPVKCESPEDLRGKLWLSVTCESQNIENLFGEMQGDDEGSGSGDIGSVTDSEPNEKVHNLDNNAIEGEFMPVNTPSNARAEPPEEPATEATELEGSGDDPEVTTEAIIVKGNQEASTAAPDYDDDDYDDDEFDGDLSSEPTPVTELPAVTIDMSLLDKSRVKACNFNCSTPSPLSDSNDTDASPAPGFFEGAKILLDDLNPVIEQHPETTTTTTTTTERPTSPLVVPEERGRSISTDKNNTSIDAEVFKNDLKDNKEKENINEEPPQQSNSTFIFLSVLLLVIICLVIYAIVKKRSTSRNHQVPPHKPEEKERIPEEMKLIKKVAPENDKPNGTHETIPLMNGHNENQHKNSEDAMIPDANDATKPADEGEDVELRPKKAEQKNLLTPEAKRVTIKASEIPNSTPKTPILVTRHVNSDGSIVTTPNIDQNV